MTTDLQSILSKLGLAQYIDKFEDEGFETWETVSDITESDLDALGVKLGHRRILQREIACSKRVPTESATSPSRPRPDEEGLLDGSKADAKSSTGTGGKRKYRRHPKPDENAPERPLSAYVIFSNKIREELKPENLSFTAIAKKVGECWQDLSAEGKEPFESEASLAKEKYRSEMTNYKTTNFYTEYQRYLLEFKAKNTSTSEEKRPRLTKEETQESTSSSDSMAGAPTEGSDCQFSPLDFRQRRADSSSPTGPLFSTSEYPSPSSAISRPPAIRTTIASSIPLGTTSPISTSPLTPTTQRELSTGPQVQQSIESRSERTSPGSGQHLPPISHFDRREAQQLTTHTSHQSPLDPRLSFGRNSPLDHYQRSTRISPSLQQQSVSGVSSKSSLNSLLSSVSTTPSSLYSSGGVDEEQRTTLSLPPPAAVTAANPLSDATSYTQQSSQSPFQASTPTGMKFESLQLPLPHNIAFGQRPLPRSEHEEKLANVFDLQDIPRERKSLRHMTLKQQHSASATPINLPGPPQPRHPPHRPALPTLDHSSHADSQENIHHPNADPLSVLAYAGRLVGRGSHRQSSK